MAKIQIFLAKLGKPAAVFGGMVADMRKIPSELAEQHCRTRALGNTRPAYGYLAKFRGQVRVTVGGDPAAAPPGVGRLSGGESWLSADSGHLQLQ
jgi:hypothetical protein